MKPEGIRENYNIPVLIDLRKERTFSTNVLISLPPFVIPDSEFVKVSVIGKCMQACVCNYIIFCKTTYFGVLNPQKNATFLYES